MMSPNGGPHNRGRGYERVLLIVVLVFLIVMAVVHGSGALSG